jgi:hypothetical protein
MSESKSSVDPGQGQTATLSVLDGDLALDGGTAVAPYIVLEVHGTLYVRALRAQHNIV